LQLAAGFAIAVGIAGVAYAVPGSPLRAWVESVVAKIGARPAPRAPVGEGPDSGIAGIAIVPGPSTLILFTTRQSAGNARITLTDGAEIAVHGPGAAATYTSTDDRLLIDNRGSVADFEIAVPNHAVRVEIRVDGERLFFKDGGHIFAAGPGDSAGRYVVSLRGR
jgi:hypothetical protein